MSEKIRWGILSTANIAQSKVIPAIKKSGNGEVLAVASRDPARARAFAEENGIPRAFGSYEGLIADPDVDAVYNPLPNSLHAEWSIRCAEAGKPTLCEKPLAAGADEAQRIVDAFAGRGVPLAEAHMYRFHPLTQRVKRMVDDGAVGELHLVRATFMAMARGGRDNIRFRKGLAGGALRDVGYYCIGIMRLLAGEEPDAGHAFGCIAPGADVDDYLAGLLSFPSGALGHFGCSLRTFFSCSYEVHGSEGRILAPQGVVPGDEDAAIIHHWRGDEYEEIRIPPADHYRLMVEDFADALLEGRPPRFPADDAVRTMEVIDRLLASAGL